MEFIACTHTDLQSDCGCTSSHMWKRLGSIICSKNPRSTTKWGSATCMHHARMCVPVDLSASGMFHIESISVSPNFSMLHATPNTIKYTETHIFLYKVSNVYQNPQRFPSHMVLTRGIAPLPFNVNAKAEESINGVPQRGTDTTVAAFHCKAIESREDQNRTAWKKISHIWWNKKRVLKTSWFVKEQFNVPTRTSLIDETISRHVTSTLEGNMWHNIVSI